MQKYSCHQPLNISVSEIISNPNLIPLPEPEKPYSFCTADPKGFLHEDVHQKLSELGGIRSMIFRSIPYADRETIHTDYDFRTNTPYWPAFNLIVKGQGIMKWFAPTNPGAKLQDINTKVPYEEWYSEFGDPVDEWTEGNVSLVRTDLPHQTWNHGVEERVAITIRWGNRTTWEYTKYWFTNEFISWLKTR